MNINPIILSVPLFFFLIGIELLLEHFQRAKRYRLNDAITNINLGTGQETVGLLMKILIPLTLYSLAYDNFAFFHLKDTWLNYIILFIAYDFCYYWAHRMSHEVNLFWSGHVVHHQSEDYNLAVALRQSWFSSIWMAPFYLPLALLGFPAEMIVWVGAINLTYQFWIHTEAVNKLGFLEWFMNTPSHHRVHHGRNEQYIDRNHAGVFIIWDKMFGTFEPEVEQPVYGITVPLSSWSPLWANFSHFFAMYDQIKETPGFMNKLGVVFRRPGWRPKALGGQMPVPYVNRATTEKFVIPIPAPLNMYALYQYFLITAGALAFFIFHSHIPKLDNLLLPKTPEVVGALLIILAVTLNGAVLEARRWALAGEFVRVLVTLGGIYWLLSLAGNPNIALIMGICGFFGLLSLAWIFSLAKHFTK